MADDDNSSKEDRQNLLQSCQPIENFLELKNPSSDIAVESVALRTDLSNDAPRTLGKNNGHDEYESLDQYFVHPSLIERWGSAMGILALVIGYSIFKSPCYNVFTMYFPSHSLKELRCCLP